MYSVSRASQEDANTLKKKKEDTGTCAVMYDNHKALAISLCNMKHKI